MNEELFYKLFPNAKPGTFDALVAVIPQAELVTPTRLRYFIAQCAHESQGFSRLEENLNYSTASRIRAVWPSRFKSEAEANRYTNRPIELANRVYANRYGNRDESSGDGWKFRGRGWIGLTFAENYVRFFKWCGLETYHDPDFVSTVDGATKSAAWYCIEHDLNGICDSGSFDGVTRKINPAMAGRLERRKILEKLEKHWG
jgi:putative chitinase